MYCIHQQVRENMVQDYRLKNHPNYYGHEEEYPVWPSKTIVDKLVLTYEERLKQQHQKAMSEYRKLLTNPKLYKQNRPTRQVCLNDNAKLI
jgi:hypothetical protein